MKKVLLIMFIFFYFSMSSINKKVNALTSDYNTYAFLNVERGKLLRDFTEDELNKEVDRVREKKWWGWSIYVLNRNVPVTFITDTVFSVYNDGNTPIDYTVNVLAETTVKTAISCTGSIGYSMKGDTKEFKGGLDSQLKLTNDYSKTELVKNQENLVIHVDPQTICLIYIEGQGLYTNGVASLHYFWMENQIGAFEYFTITNSYLRIEKIKL